MNGSNFFLDLCLTFMKNGYERTEFSKKVTDYGVWVIKIKYELNNRAVILTLVEIHDEHRNSETVKIEQVGVTPEIVLFHETEKI